MNKEVQEAAEALRAAILRTTDEYTTSVSLFLNCEGWEYQVRTRTPQSLRDESISMKNVHGDFIR